MATQSSKPAARQLGELLKQQQEPFVLEIYLSERGCLKKKKLSPGSPKFGCHGSSGKFLKMNNKGIPNFPKALKLVMCNKLFAIKGLKTKNSDDENGKVSATAEPDRFSTGSCTTVYNSCTDTDTDEPSMINQAAADSKFQWSSRQKSLFLSELIMEDSILLLLQATPDKPSCVRELQEAGGSNSLLFSTSKRVLQNSKKLEEDERKECLGCSTQEWNDYEHQKEEVGLVLGNAIEDEIVAEVVMDMMFMFHD